MTKSERGKIRRAIDHFMADRWEMGMRILSKMAGIHIPAIELRDVVSIDIRDIIRQDRRVSRK